MRELFIYCYVTDVTSQSNDGASQNESKRKF